MSPTPGSGGAACLPAGHLRTWFWAAGPGGGGAGGGGGSERNGASQQGPGSQDGAAAWREVHTVGARGVRGLFVTGVTMKRCPCRTARPSGPSTRRAPRATEARPLAPASAPRPAFPGPGPVGRAETPWSSFVYTCLKGKPKLRANLNVGPKFTVTLMAFIWEERP